MILQFSSVQSVASDSLRSHESQPGLPVHHQLPEFIQTHVHRVGDAIQPSHPLSSPSPPAPNPSQHQGLFCEAARVNTMTGSPDLSFSFPWNGKIPYPHQATWSQPVNMCPVRKKGIYQGKAEKPANTQVWKKPAKVWTNKIVLQTCNQSA